MLLTGVINFTDREVRGESSYVLSPFSPKPQAKGPAEPPQLYIPAQVDSLLHFFSDLSGKLDGFFRKCISLGFFCYLRTP